MRDVSTIVRDFIDWTYVSDEDYVLIHDVYVPAKYRGHGCAKAALEYAIGRIKEDYPGKRIRLSAEVQYSHVYMDGLIRLYESVGFERTAVTMEYKGDSE